VIQAGDHDGLSGLPGAGDGAADVQGEGGHVGAEDDLLGAGGVKPIGHGLVGGFQHSIRLAAAGKGAAVVGVVQGEVVHHALQSGLGDLRSAGVIKVIKVDHRAAQGGKTRTNQVQVEGHITNLRGEWDRGIEETPRSRARPSGCRQAGGICYT